MPGSSGMRDSFEDLTQFGITAEHETTVGYDRGSASNQNLFEP